MLVSSQSDLSLFFDMIFDFIRTGRIHSSVDHMSDYTSIKNIILSSKLTEFRYNPRFDSYSFFLENQENYLVDIVLIFSFGKSAHHQIMITLNNSKIYFELALSGIDKHIPVMNHHKSEVLKGFSKIRSKFKKNKDKPQPKEVMSFEEFNFFLDDNKVQKGFRNKNT